MRIKCKDLATIAELAQPEAAARARQLQYRVGGTARGGSLRHVDVGDDGSQPEGEDRTPTYYQRRPTRQALTRAIDWARSECVSASGQAGKT